MPFVELGDEKLYYTDSRSPGKPILLMIHGSGGSHRHWPKALRELGDVHVYAIDLPGHGRSTGKSRSRVEDYADVIDVFVTSLGLSGVTLAGHSLGGAIVQVLALREPDWLARVVLVGTGCRLRVLPAILDGLLSDHAQTIGLMGEMVFGSDVPSSLVAAAQTDFLKTPPTVTHDDLSACDKFDVTKSLGEIKLPAMIVCGFEDRMTPVKYGEFLKSHIPDSRLAVIDRAGHMMALEQPSAFVRIIRDFIR